MPGLAWRHYRRAYGLLAALATPLVLSVHSVVSWDFAMALVPGWHSTLFAPFFVNGAIFSGFAMVLVLIIPMRHYFHLHAYVTDRHLDMMGKLVLVTSLVLTYFYVCETFTAWYSGDHFERASLFWKATESYAWASSDVLLQQPAPPSSGSAPHSRDTLYVVSLWCSSEVVRAVQHHRPGLAHAFYRVGHPCRRHRDRHRQLRMVLPPVPRMMMPSLSIVEVRRRCRRRSGPGPWQPLNGRLRPRGHDGPRARELGPYTTHRLHAGARARIEDVWTAPPVSPPLHAARAHRELPASSHDLVRARGPHRRQPVVSSRRSS